MHMFTSQRIKALIVILVTSIVQNTIQDMSEDIMMVGKMLKMEYKTPSAKLDVSLDLRLYPNFILSK